MDNRPIIYIPLYNAEDWCRELILDPGFKYVASNNCSTDDSANILIKKGVEVINQHHNLGRIGNWQFCIDHFRASEGEWMSFLFTGDSFVPNASKYFYDIIPDTQDANIIIFQYDIIDDVISSTRTLNHTRLLGPHESLVLAVEQANWYGGVLGNFINKKAFFGPYRFSELGWAADYKMFVDLSANVKIFYSPLTIGKFDAKSRLYFKKFKYDIQSLYEENLVKWDAISKLEKIGYSKQMLNRLKYVLGLKVKILEIRFAYKSANSFSDYFLMLLRYNPLVYLEYFIYKMLNKNIILL
ncbi:hypothetical protein ACFSR6_16860 [Pedobacter vanadiisoli]|uniref:Glycosyl transferase family 2 n=1 Tax=Pedobacter vanadiisoli TaxID=1761975 RepID=A0ABW5MM48_9SPHI